MKKIVSLILAMTMTLALFAGCRGGGNETSGEPSTDASTTDDTSKTDDGSKKDFKIGILTGTVSQGEEEFRQAELLKAKYGDQIITKTYPDNFNAEQDTYISLVTEMASDPDVKAIVFCQAVPGTSPAIDKVRETRDDILFIADVPSEDPSLISERADIILLIDELGTGTKMVQQAKKQGAETFVHYSFPRHLSMETITLRRDEIKKECEKQGMKYIEADAPDPLSDAGVQGAQVFMKEDVPRKVKEYGKNTAFFSTNCSMQEPLIKAVLDEGAIFPQQCCPSPYHGYPAALNIEVTGHEGDVPYMLDQTKEKITEGGNTGRMSTWKFPVNMLSLEASVEYAMDYCEGKTDGKKFDEELFKEKINKVAKDSYGATCEISKYTVSEEGKEDKVYDNFFVILGDYFDF